MTPEQWARKAIDAYDAFRCDSIVAETNNGGDLVMSVIRNAADHLCTTGGRRSREVSITKVNASRGKVARAQPISMLYEQNRVHHVGLLAELEDEMVQFVPDALAFSPDRVDAAVWGLTEISQATGYVGFVF